MVLNWKDHYWKKVGIPAISYHQLLQGLDLQGILNTSAPDLGDPCMVVDVWAVFRWVILYCSGVFGDSNKELVRIPMNQPIFMKWDIIKFLVCGPRHVHVTINFTPAIWRLPSNHQLFLPWKVLSFNRKKEAGPRCFVSFCNWRFVNTFMDQSWTQP